MKHWRPALLITCLLLSVAATASAAPLRPQATPRQIRDAIDARLAQLWPAVQEKQNAFYIANGRYWQGLRTHNVLPADGAERLPDIGGRTPTDQPDPWPAALANVQLPMALQMDVYDGPLGVGYVASVWVMVNSRIWTRSANVGPETWRTEAWHEVEVGP